MIDFKQIAICPTGAEPFTVLLVALDTRGRIWVRTIYADASGSDWTRVDSPTAGAVK